MMGTSFGANILGNLLGEDGDKSCQKNSIAHRSLTRALPREVWS